MPDIVMDAPGVMKHVAREVLYDIDQAAIAMYGAEGPRTHLGASLIGDKCLRKLWYGFRWVDWKIHTGRQYRLFNRGHKEEERFVEWLRFAGYRVEDRDPATGKQWVVSTLDGHFGGSMDGKAWLPAKFNYSKPLLLEFKTNGTGAGFTKLTESGCVIGKPQHFDQQTVYGYIEKVDYSLYLNVNKNDDDIHAEIVKIDHRRGADMERKAKVIILAMAPPDRISNQPAFFECKMCDFNEVCHQGKQAKVNCRSCRNSMPGVNKTWTCSLYGNQAIPADFIKTGCEHWKSIA